MSDPVPSEKMRELAAELRDLHKHVGFMQRTTHPTIQRGAEAILSLLDEIDKLRADANDIDHDGKPILWRARYHEALDDYKAERARADKLRAERDEALRKFNHEAHISDLRRVERDRAEAALAEALAEREWQTDFTRAPRDGTWVDLRAPNGDVTRLFWSEHYSIHGLGGCWTEGFATMSDLDFNAWRAAAIRQGK